MAKQPTPSNITKNTWPAWKKSVFSSGISLPPLLLLAL
jgi:hypothetical protein